MNQPSLQKVEILEAYNNCFPAEGFDPFGPAETFPDAKVYKENKHRGVIRFSAMAAGRKTQFFLKRHFSPEKKDKIRDLCSLRWPLSDARQELENIRAVDALGISTMKPAAWGEEAGGLLSRRSFLITESLGDLERLENYFVRNFAKKLSPPELREKRRLIKAVAHLARRLHSAHLYHHDFYCGHILVKEVAGADPALYLIDLQRVRRHRWFEIRWRGKDLSALNYTADPRAISRADRLRFFLHYFNLPTRPAPRLTLFQKYWIWSIQSRTRRIARHTEKKRARYLKK